MSGTPSMATVFTLRPKIKAKKWATELRVSPIKKQRRLKRSRLQRRLKPGGFSMDNSLHSSLLKSHANNNLTPSLNCDNSSLPKSVSRAIKQKHEAGERVTHNTVQQGSAVYIAGRKSRNKVNVQMTKKHAFTLKDFQEIKWLSKRGQADKKKRSKRHDEYMMLWFEFLDVDGDQSVSAEELEDPLVSLGLARNRREAEKLVQMYDQDGDMELDFDEFRKLLQGKRVSKRRVPLKDRMYRKKHSTSSKTTANKPNFQNTTESRIDAMFDKISSGSVRSSNGLPLDISISAYRRKLLMDANMSPRDDDKRKGMYVLKGILESRNAMQEPPGKQENMTYGKSSKRIHSQTLVVGTSGLSTFKRLANRVAFNQKH